MCFCQGNDKTMSWLKKILMILVIIFIVMQFVQPKRNIQGNSFVRINMPENVKRIMSQSCFDCHSNNTRYPWYSRVQPIGWMLARHIKQGKADLNFDEFTSYSERRQLNKLRSIETSIKEGTMPIASYLLIHHDARLSAAEKLLITEWAQRTTDSITHKINVTIHSTDATTKAAGCNKYINEKFDVATDTSHVDFSRISTA